MKPALILGGLLALGVGYVYMSKQEEEEEHPQTPPQIKWLSAGQGRLSTVEGTPQSPPQPVFNLPPAPTQNTAVWGSSTYPKTKKEAFTPAEYYSAEYNDWFGTPTFSSHRDAPEGGGMSELMFGDEVPEDIRMSTKKDLAKNEPLAIASTSGGVLFSPMPSSGGGGSSDTMNTSNTYTTPQTKKNNFSIISASSSKQAVSGLNVASFTAKKESKKPVASKIGGGVIYG
jgi:hypothetical protein